MLDLYSSSLPYWFFGPIRDRLFVPVGWKLGPGKAVTAETLRLKKLGFVDRSVARLEELTQTGTAISRRQAGWELASYYALETDPALLGEALRFLHLLSKRRLPRRLARQSTLVGADVLRRLNRVAEAQAMIATAMGRDKHADLYLAAANGRALSDKGLWINRALQLHKLQPVSLDGDANSLKAELGNIHRDGPTISVLVVLHNSAETANSCLQSLRNQTWSNLEIIVVDDASDDSTARIVADYADQDDRIHIIRNTRERGLFSCLNQALHIGTGELVTCHDSESWAHPQKIEIQARHLLAKSRLFANTSQRVHVTRDFDFLFSGMPGQYCSRDSRSIMFRRAVMLQSLGAWDSTHYSADLELMRRANLVFGQGNIYDLQSGPMSIQFISKNEATLPTNSAKASYLESADAYHARSSSLRYEYPQKRRLFYAPQIIRKGIGVSQKRRHFDVVIASDFRLAGGSTLSSVEEVKCQSKAGLSTGLVQLNRYDVKPDRMLRPDVRELIDGGVAELLVEGEKASCDLLIIRYPPVVFEYQRTIPDIASKVIRVIINQPPMSDYGKSGVLRYVIPQCAANIRRKFGKDAEWCPIGPSVRNVLLDKHAPDLDAITLASDDWVNIIDVDDWARGDHSPNVARPRIGRHARDNPVKWPESTDILKVYPETEGFDVRILGGARSVRKLIGYIPQIWTVYDFGKLHPKEFLRDLDVFVYYHHPTWVESFGRTIIEAMAVGVPVVLAPHFQDLFEDAAVYADIHDVKEVVESIVSNPARYASLVKRGRAYVRKNFSYDTHLERIARFREPDVSQTAEHKRA